MKSTSRVTNDDLAEEQEAPGLAQRPPTDYADSETVRRSGGVASSCKSPLRHVHYRMGRLDLHADHAVIVLVRQGDAEAGVQGRLCCRVGFGEHLYLVFDRLDHLTYRGGGEAAESSPGSPERAQRPCARSERRRSI